MKRCWVIIGLFFLLQDLPAQKIVSGNVSLFNSRYKTGRQVFVSEVEINGECCTTPGYSDANGYYQLVFRNLPGEARVIVTKKGMHVINEPDLRFIPEEGKENRLNIYVFDSGELAKEIRRIRTAIEKDINKRYDSSINELRAENKGLKTALQNLSLQFNASNLSISQAKKELDKKRMEDLYYAGKQAEDLVRTNLDEANESTVKAFEAFINGDMKKVLSLTANLNPEKDADDIARLRELKLVPYIIRARAAVMEFQFDLADATYRQSFRVDSLNPDVLTEYAVLLHLREENADPIFRSYEKSLPLYEKAIPLFEKLIHSHPVTYAPNYARALHNAAIIYAQDYTNTQKRFQAEAYLERSLEIIRGLTAEEPGIYEWKLARTWSSIGRFYKEKAAFGGSDEAAERSDTGYTNAASIYRRLANADPLTYLPELAASLEDKAYLYADVVGDREKAARLFREALQVRELLLGKGLPGQQTAHLYGIRNLADTYKDAKKFNESFSLSNQYVPVAEKRLIQASRRWEKDSLMEIIRAFYKNIAESGLHTGKFKEAEMAARKISDGYGAEGTQRYIAAALLLQGKYKEAEVLYKKIQTDPDIKSWALELLNDLENENAIPNNRIADVTRIRGLLNE